MSMKDELVASLTKATTEYECGLGFYWSQELDYTKFKFQLGMYGWELHLPREFKSDKLKFSYKDYYRDYRERAAWVHSLIFDVFFGVILTSLILTIVAGGVYLYLFI